MAKKLLFAVPFLILFAILVQAEVKVERVIRDIETITAEDVCLGLKIIRKDFYTYKNREDKDLDSSVVWIYQKDTNRLIIQDKLKNTKQEIWEAIVDSVATTDFLDW